MSALPADPARAPAAFVHALAGHFDAVARSLPEGGPGWLAERRRAHLEAVLASGLPAAREEAWKYTPLRALERRRFAHADPDAASRPVDAALFTPAGLDGPRLVFVNGRFRGDLSRVDALPQGLSLRPLASHEAHGAALERLFAARPSARAADAFAHVNASLATEGVLLEAAAGACIAPPVHLVFVGAPADADLLVNLRHLVELGDGARLTLIERHIDAGEHAHLANHVAVVRLGEGAQLQHVRLQQAAPAAGLIARTEVEVAAGAHYHPVALELGGALSRHEWNVLLQGGGAACSLRGVVLAGARQQVDTRLSLQHAAGNTRSDTVWRAIAGGRARSAFHGGISIAPGADGSDAALQTRSLLLSDHAEIDAQPVLVIEADEIKASHGAAVGQLDAAALFYLRTRGIPERQARHLLIHAFCQAALRTDPSPVEGDALHALLTDAISSRLAQLEPPA